ncbi:hypothetical protein MJG53_009190 [Ovis ammon polii x Ovis aries]|uniref:Uncharacterized protein n=1 Tax=Ovis ammon polii x Ovis aries TaxID=2918886 RepID=A0ACB9UZ49_9CETA|nr:hypothetical protein MJG53_009190 [Ovis ammon polii x Ovis aries]
MTGPWSSGRDLRRRGEKPQEKRPGLLSAPEPLGPPLQRLIQAGPQYALWGLETLVGAFKGGGSLGTELRGLQKSSVCGRGWREEEVSRHLSLEGWIRVAFRAGRACAGSRSFLGPGRVSIGTGTAPEMKDSVRRPLLSSPLRWSHPDPRPLPNRDGDLPRNSPHPDEPPPPPESYEYRTEAESVMPSTTSELEPLCSLSSVKPFFASPPAGLVGVPPDESFYSLSSSGPC